jgi:hypothetical protein
MYTPLFKGLTPFFVSALLVVLSTTAIAQSLVGKRFLYQGSDWVKHEQLHFISNTTVEGSKDGKVITMSYKRDGDFVFFNLYGNQATVFKLVGTELRGAMVDERYALKKTVPETAIEETVQTQASSEVQVSNPPVADQTSDVLVADPFLNAGGVDDASSSPGDGRSDGVGGNGVGGNGVGPDGCPLVDGNGAYNLQGRSLVRASSINFDVQEEGKVVMDIFVDRQGHVVQVKPNYKRSSTTNAALYEQARKAAFESRFSAAPGGPLVQRGMMTFWFVWD